MPHDIPRCTFARMLVLGGATLLASACDEPAPEPVVLDFRAVVDGVPFACGERYEGIGTSEASFEPLDLRFYLHGFELVDASGQRFPTAPVEDDRWQRDGFVLVDFEDGTGACATGSPSTHTQVTLENEAGIAVAGVVYRIGLPPENNHLDAATAPPPLNEPGMWWSWRGGYKYVKADVQIESGDPFYFHLGGTECDGDPASGFSCGYANISEVELSLDPASEAIVVDLARLYDGVDINAPVDHAVDSVPGCMAFSGDPECPDMFDALGLVFESTEPGGEVQRMFGVEARP
jgi:uncharacterized repeat protein (TIGR04052 family)